MSSLKNQLTKTIAEALAKNPNGGWFVLGGNSRHNAEMIDTLNEIANVEEAVEIQRDDREGKDILVRVGAAPTIEITYED